METKRLKEILWRLEHTDQLEEAASRLAAFYSEKADAARDALREIDDARILGVINNEDEDAVAAVVKEVLDRWKKAYYRELDESTEKESRETSARFKAMEKDIASTCGAFIDTCGAYIERRVGNGVELTDGELLDLFDKAFCMDDIYDKCWKWKCDICRQINDTDSDLFHVNETWRGDNGFMGRA